MTDNISDSRMEWDDNPLYFSNWWGCEYCAGVGYMDYPQNKKPCPVPGHVERFQADLRVAEAWIESRKKPYSVDDGPCPYCKATHACEHWTGNGWARDGYKGQKQWMIP